MIQQVYISSDMSRERNNTLEKAGFAISLIQFNLISDNLPVFK